MRTWNNGGGFIGISAKVEPEVFIQRGSSVLGNAVVKGDSVIAEGSVISGDAIIVDSKIFGHSVVKDKAQVVSSTIRLESEISGVASILSSEVSRVKVARFSQVVGSELTGGWVQGDVWFSSLKDCKVLGKVVKGKSQ